MVKQSISKKQPAIYTANNYDFYEQAKKDKIRENLILENVSAVLHDRVIEDASVRITNGIITELDQGFIPGVETRINGKRKTLIPGIIDLHSDALEKIIEPRPNVVFPLTNAITGFDKTLPAYGITTMFHCIAFMHTDFRRILRNNDNALKILNELLFMRPYLKTRSCIHIRYDIINRKIIPLLEKLAHENKVNLLSFMDHTPGQGQFQDEERYIEMMSKMYGRTKTELKHDVADRKRARMEFLEEELYGLASEYLHADIPLASHDDDCADKIQRMAELGVSISEFPINEEAIQAASDRGLHTIVGAPNIIMGKSHSGNLSARIAIKKTIANIICSDYIPASIFHSLFLLRDIDMIPFPDIIKMATLNPARAVGLDHLTGSIETGKWADLVLCCEESGIPQIERTFVQGYEVYKTI